MNRDTNNSENDRERGEETPEQLTPRDLEKGRKKQLSTSADEAESSADSANLSARLGRYSQSATKRSLAGEFNDQASAGANLSSSPYGFTAFFPSAAAASPPKFVSVDELMHAVQTIQNMQLAHEIATDTSFRLEKHLTASPRHNQAQSTSSRTASTSSSGAGASAAESLEAQIERTVKRAFWDALQAKLEADPPDYSHAIVLLTETKQELLGLLLPHSTALRNEVEQVLDLDLLRQQIEHGALDMAKYADYIIGLMARMCAPARDEQVAAVRALAAREEPGWSSAKKCVEIFKSIFEMLELLKLDMANFTIAQMRPVIQQHSVEYEQAQFAKLLEEQRKHGVDGLECTRKWMQSAFDGAFSDSITKDADVVTALVVNEAFVTLLDDSCTLRLGSAPAAASNATIQLPPETLLLDGSRIDALRDRIDAYVLVSATLLVVGACVPHTTTDAELRASLKRQLFVLFGCNEDAVSAVPTEPSELLAFLESVAERVTNETKEHCSRRDRPLTEDQVRALSGQLADLFRKHAPTQSQSQQNAVRSLLKRRLLDFVRCILAAKYKTPMPPSAVNWLQSSTNASTNASATTDSQAQNQGANASLRFPAQIRIPAGLGIVEAELASACSQLLRLIDYNRRVFGRYYREMVAQMIESREAK